MHICPVEIAAFVQLMESLPMIGIAVRHVRTKVTAWWAKRRSG